MEERFNNEESLVRYLLGQVSEEEATRVEEQYFDDKDWFEQLEVVESELIDSYVCNRLSEKDRQAFEKHFLHVPERRQKIAFARTFQQLVEKPVASQTLPEKPSFYQSLLNFFGHHGLRLAPAAIALLLLLGCLWLVIDNQRLKNRLQEAQNSAGETEKTEQELQDRLRQEGEEAEQLANDLQRERNSRSTQDPSENGLQPAIAQLASFTLLANTVRSTGGIQRLEVPAGAKTVRLTMDFANAKNSEVEATLKRLASENTLQRARLKPRAMGTKSQIRWSLPATALDNGDYLVTIRDPDESDALIALERFAFRVIKK